MDGLDGVGSDGEAGGIVVLLGGCDNPRFGERLYSMLRYRGDGGYPGLADPVGRVLLTVAPDELLQALRQAIRLATHYLKRSLDSKSRSIGER